MPKLERVQAQYGVDTGVELPVPEPIGTNRGNPEYLVSDLTRFRLSHGVTQAMVADALHMMQPGISNLESGDLRGRNSDPRIADYIDVISRYVRGEAMPTLPKRGHFRTREEAEAEKARQRAQQASPGYVSGSADRSPGALSFVEKQKAEARERQAQYNREVAAMRAVRDARHLAAEAERRAARKIVR
jgi:hypothetical protein